MRFQTLFEGRLIFAAILILAAVGQVTHQTWLLILSALLFLFCMNFFRDPQRDVPEGDDLVVAAADGVIDNIEILEETEFLNAKCQRVSIFLSVFDVHVNKSPIAGKVTYLKHHPGLYLDARNPECSKKNEALTWAIEGSKATLVVRQITGAIARRIVPWSQVGDTIPKGFRFGMIRFGSRTEIYLPLDAKLEVKLGDRVLGAQTIIARLS
ncbi:MAG: phosphatidylserine decarboxylase family protein [Verrucomicrobia bacterium]|nr:phosphatidylserine decarboxylase family protein [Verrucomicrobiota bacterium]